MTTTRTRVAVGGALLVSASLLLTGCSAVEDILGKVHEESFDSRAAASEGWVGVTMPSWIPEDATTISSVATTDETNSVISTDGNALAGECVEAERLKIPFDARFGELPDPLPGTVMHCGAYEVAQVDGGWLGWFGATEPGQRPDE
jgi:hypothetical protein